MAGQRRGMLEAFLAARRGTARGLRLFVGAACMPAREPGTSLGVGATCAAAMSTLSARVVVGVLECHWCSILVRARRKFRLECLGSRRNSYTRGN